MKTKTFGIDCPTNPYYEINWLVLIKFV